MVFRDPGVGEFGLTNALMPLGETWLEVVSPEAPDAPARRWLARRGGDAGYMAIFQCAPEALDDEVARAEGAGARSVWRGEREGGRTVHFHPRELGAIASLDAMPAWNDWVWARPPGAAVAPASGSGAARATIAAVELAGPDPAALAGRWAALLGLAAPPAGDPAPVLELPRGGALRFRAGPEAALTGLDVAGLDPARFAQRARARGVLETDGAARIAGTRIAPSGPA